MTSKINREQAVEAAKLAIEVERYEWRHLWKFRLLRLVTSTGAGFLYGLALGLAADIYALHILSAHV